MSRWFRVYDDLVDDPKIQRLPGDLVKALLNLWCLASQNDGVLPAADDIAFKLRMKPAKVEEILSRLGECGLIDSDETSLRPHNWAGRQFKSDVSNERVKRHRNGKRNVTSTVTETPPDTEQIQRQSKSEKEETRETALTPADDWPTDYREQFWSKYPHKVGKPDALGKLDRARKSGATTWATLWAGLERYIAKTDDRPWCNPATWIHQQRWTDQPAATAQNHGQRPHHAPRQSGSADFFAGLAQVAADIDRDGDLARTADAGIPRGRHEFDA